MKTAVIYARYSSDSQTEQSIDGQLRVCQEYAARNDILIVDTYVDRAMTGKNDNRPDFRRIIHDSDKKQWNYVIVYKLDRFSRNKYEMAVHKKTLKDNGVKVVSATEFIPDTPEGIIFESMLEGYAEYYSAELSQKIRRGNNESRHKGNLTGGKIPYGYYREGKKAAVDEDKAEVVRFIYRQYSRGIYVEDIIADLTSKGIYYNGKPFVKNTVYKILKNERYSGIYHYGDEVFDNIYPVIVAPEIYEKVRRRVESRRYGKKSREANYRLRGKMKCGYCGESIIGESGTAHDGSRRYYYKCRGRKVNINNCHLKPVRKEILEKTIFDALVKEMSKPPVIDEIVEGLLKIQDEQSESSKMLRVLQSQKEEVETAITNIVNAVQMGIVTPSITARLQELEKQRDDLEREIVIEKSKVETKLTEQQIRAFYNQALSMEPTIILDYFVEEITLFDNKIIIRFKQPPQSPDSNGRGFLFSTCYVHYTFAVPYRVDMTNIYFKIELVV